MTCTKGSLWNRKYPYSALPLHNLWDNIYQVQLNQIYVLHRLIKKSINITFEVAWLTKSNAMCWNITLASFSLIVYVFFLSESYNKERFFVQVNQSNLTPPSPIITREDNLRLLKMIRIPSWNLPCTLNIQACPSPLGICHLFWKSCKCPTVGPGLHTENPQLGFKLGCMCPTPGQHQNFIFQ